MAPKWNLPDEIVLAQESLDTMQQRKLRDAVAAIDSLGQQFGAFPTRANVKTANDYAQDVLGSLVYAPWLYMFTMLSDDGFREGWIPTNYFEAVVVKKLNGSARFVSRTKTLSHRFLATDALPDRAYYVKGRFYDSAMHPIDFAGFMRLLSEFPTLIAKADRSMAGHGIAKFSSRDASPEFFAQLGDCVVQEFIEQHDALVELSPSAVAALRITTVKLPGQSAQVRASYLLVGADAHEWVESGHIMKVAVHTDSGRLHDRGALDDWTIVRKHPGTGFVFGGRPYPRFADAAQLCLRLHETLPQFGIIGWDVSVDSQNQLKILEWNAGLPGTKFSEAMDGPNFRGLGWEQLRPAS